MIIYDLQEKGKFLGYQKLFISSLILLINLGVFGGWKLYKLQSLHKPITFDTSKLELRSIDIPASDLETNEKQQVLSTSTARTTGKYVASRGGATYHLLTCAGAKRISEKNKIFFNSKEEAEQFGYKPAKNCKGI